MCTQFVRLCCRWMDPQTLYFWTDSRAVHWDNHSYTSCERVVAPYLGVRCRTSQLGLPLLAHRLPLGSSGAPLMVAIPADTWGRRENALLVETQTIFLSTFTKHAALATIWGYLGHRFFQHNFLGSIRTSPATVINHTYMTLRLRTLHIN